METKELIVYEQTTVLTQRNIRLLCRMFETKEDYNYYMETLWILRSLVSEKIERNSSNGLYDDKDDKSFPILETTNDLIGALLNDKWDRDQMSHLKIHKK